MMKTDPMSEVWEKFAEVNAEFYILTDMKVDYSTPYGQKLFYDSGRYFVEKSFSSVKKYLKNNDRAIEIGCGIGRLTFPHSEIFNEVFAVDISETMLRKLKNKAGDDSIDNIKTLMPHEKWDISEYFDYAYSFLVFQHIEDFSKIQHYSQRIARSLRVDGIAQLQFDTRNETLFYKIRNFLPDSFLPKTQHNGIKRIRRDPELLRSVFKENNLDIIREIAAETELHTFILRKSK